MAVYFVGNIEALDDVARTDQGLDGLDIVGA